MYKKENAATTVLIKVPYQRNCECNRIDKYSDIFIDGITQQLYSSLVGRFTPVDVRGRYGSHVARALSARNVASWE